MRRRIEEPAAGLTEADAMYDRVMRLREQRREAKNYSRAVELSQELVEADNKYEEMTANGELTHAHLPHTHTPIFRAN